MLNNLTLKSQWIERLKLRAEGRKLWAESEQFRAESEKLWAEGKQIWAEGEKLWAQSDKLWAQSDKHRAEGGKLWAEAILEIFGNIKLEWKYRNGDYDCELENGEVYNWDMNIDE